MVYSYLVISDPLSKASLNEIDAERSPKVTARSVGAVGASSCHSATFTVAPEVTAGRQVEPSPKPVAPANRYAVMDELNVQS